MQQNQNHPDLVDQDQSVEFKKLIRGITDNWLIIATIGFLGLVTAYVFTKFSDPIYKVKASVIVKELKDVRYSSSDNLFGQQAYNQQNLENSKLLFKTKSLMEKTLRDLGYNVSYYVDGPTRKNELYGNSPITILVDTSSTNIPTGVFTMIKIKNEGSYELEVEEASVLDMEFMKEKDPVVEAFRKEVKRGKYFFGQPVEVNGLSFQVIYDEEQGKQYEGETLFIKFHSFGSLAETYANSIQIDNRGVESTSLMISRETKHPKKGIAFLNRLIENRIAESKSNKDDITQRTIDFLEKQMGSQQEEVSSIKDQLESFRATNASSLNAQGEQINTNISRLRGEASSLQKQVSYLTSLQEQLNSSRFDLVVSPQSAGINDSQLNKLIDDIIDFQNQINNLQSNGSVENPFVAPIRDKIEYRKFQASDLSRQLKGQLSSSLSGVNGSISSLGGRLQNMPSAQMQDYEIQRGYEMAEKLYIGMNEKWQLEKMKLASNTSDISFIDYASMVGKGPIKPNKMLNYIIGLFLGLMFPAAFFVIRELVNETIENETDLKGATQIPFMGFILRKDKSENVKFDPNSKSAFAESIRTLRSNIKYFSPKSKDGSQIYLFTSTFSGEGKSFCASNLAHTFAISGKKSILVSGDMRKRNDYSDHGIIQNNYGLSDYLAGLVPFQEIICKSSTSNLSLIPSGDMPPNPAELLLNGKFDELLGKLREEYEVIIIDTPPMGIISDALELMSKADLNIYVTRQGVTKSSQLANVNNMFNSGKIDDLVIILNDVNYKKLSYYYGYEQYYNQTEEKGVKKIFKNISSKFTKTS